MINTYSLKSWLFCALLAIASGADASSPLKVVYPNINGNGVNAYGYAVLKLALENAGVDFRLQVNERQVNDKRMRSMIDEGRVSIADFGTSEEFEQDFLPIYFPIDMGISGWRIFVIRTERQTEFSRIQNILSLRNYSAGQGIGWSDTNILRRAGFQVSNSPDLSSLFLMLRAGRFDFLPLGANEIHSFMDSNARGLKDITVESNLVLVYPFARMFFVKQGNEKLRDIVLLGLQRAFDNGSFWQLYTSHAHIKPLFTKVGLDQRRLIRISNPLFEKSLRNIDSKYFFRLEMLDKHSK